MDKEAANAARCEDRPGTYEAWYLTVSDPASRRGFWLRHTTLNPASGAYPFLANFVVDGAIVLITYWFYRAAKSELAFPAQ